VLLSLLSFEQTMRLRCPCGLARPNGGLLAQGSRDLEIPHMRGVRAGHRDLRRLIAWYSSRSSVSLPLRRGRVVERDNTLYVE
jgi:hypothetical protein